MERLLEMSLFLSLSLSFSIYLSIYLCIRKSIHCQVVCFLLLWLNNLPAPFSSCSPSCLRIFLSHCPACHAAHTLTQKHAHRQSLLSCLQDNHQVGGTVKHCTEGHSEGAPPWNFERREWALWLHEKISYTCCHPWHLLEDPSSVWLHGELTHVCGMMHHCGLVCEWMIQWLIHVRGMACA